MENMCIAYLVNGYCINPKICKLQLVSNTKYNTVVTSVLRNRKKIKVLHNSVDSASYKISSTNKILITHVFKHCLFKMERKV